MPGQCTTELSPDFCVFENKDVCVQIRQKAKYCIIQNAFRRAHASKEEAYLKSGGA